MDLPALAAAIDSTCRVSGDFTLRSGISTTEYFDKYLFEGDPALLRAVADQMVPLLPRDTEVLGGLELGGVPIATILSSLTGLPTLFVRKEAKTYGTCKLAEGGDFTGRRVTLIEDIVTTGGAARNAALALRERGAVIDTLVCAIDRSAPGANHLPEIGLRTVSVLTKKDLDQVRAVSP